MDSKITQLMPAESWYALYWSSAPPYYSLRRLIAFALIVSDDRVGTDGIDQDSCRASLGGSLGEAGDFGGYYHESEINDTFRQTHEAAGSDRSRRKREAAEHE